MAVAQIPDLKNWEVSAQVGELDRGHLTPGQQVSIAVVALAGKTFPGHVKSLGGTAGSPWDRHFECRISLDQPAPELRPGMTSNMVITVETLDNVTLGPLPGAVRKRWPHVRLPARPQRLHAARRHPGAPQRKPGRAHRRLTKATWWPCPIPIEQNKPAAEQQSAMKALQQMIFASADIGQALANLRAQKTRTLLTALGIVFGVGSVIGMLAIGAGAREESLRFIEQLGVRNVLVDSRPATSQEEFQQRRRSSPGLSERDVRILNANIEALETLSARRTLHPACVLPKPSRDIPETVRRASILRRHPQPASGRRRSSSTKPTTPPAPRSASWARAPRSTCSATAPPSASSSR